MDLSEAFEHQLTSFFGDRLCRKYQWVMWADPWCFSLCCHSDLGLCQKTPGSYGAEFFASYHDLIENFTNWFNCSHSIHIKFYCFTSWKPMNTRDLKIHLIGLYFCFKFLFGLVFNWLIESIAAIYQLPLIISVVSTALPFAITFTVIYFFPIQI